LGVQSRARRTVAGVGVGLGVGLADGAADAADADPAVPAEEGPTLEGAPGEETAEQAARTTETRRAGTRRRRGSRIT
jgi:hypothetical protein